MAYGRALTSAGGAAVKSLASSALDVIPGGGIVKGIIGSVFGGKKAPPYNKSLRETRQAAVNLDIATLQHKLVASKYPEVRAAAARSLAKLEPGGERYSLLLASGKALPTLTAGNATQSGLTYSQSMGAAPAGLTDATSPAPRRRRKRRKTTRRSYRRKSRSKTRRRRRSSGRKLKFGSRAYRLKYLGYA